MNKYVYIVLTTCIPFATICMEKERKKDVLNIQTEQSIALQSNSPLLQFDTLNGLLKTNPLPIQTIRKQYSDIGFDFVPVYVQSNRNESSSTDDIPLTPIYRPITGSTTEYFDCITGSKKSILQEEQKPNIYINTFTQINRDGLINELYDAAGLYKIYCDKSIYDLNKHQQLIRIINLMQEAKQYGINEDYMSKHAYKRSSQYGYFKAFTPLLFSYLKKYIATTSITNETVPFNGALFNAHTVKTLKLSCQPITTNDIDDILKSYPAYENLINSFTKQPMQTGFNDLINYLYGDAEAQFNQNQYRDITTFDAFYFCAYQLLHDFEAGVLSIGKPRSKTVYNIINLVEYTKIRDLTSCKNMCDNIFQFNPEQTFKIWWNHGNISFITSSRKKNSIAMLYLLTKDYINAKKNKKTPTPAQYAAYRQKTIDIALPDNFNPNIFDKKLYAFKAFHRLKDGITTFANTDCDTLQSIVELKIKQL